MENEEEGEISGAALPEYVRKQPWYFKTDNESIDHQRIAPYAEKKRTDLSEFYRHGANQKKEVGKWEPGCCKNCGSNTHTEQECTERPKRNNARVTGVGIARKDVAERHDLSWEAKHDQFAQYSAKRWRMEVSGQFRHADRMWAAQPAKPREIEIREEYGHSNFRNREDTARYLKNMNEVGEDNDLWASETPQNNQKQQNEIETIEQRRKMREFEESKKLLSRTGASSVAQEAIPKSKYGDLEDRYVNGHTSVFGSYFQDGKWGYACCKQLAKNSFCTNAK